MSIYEKLFYEDEKFPVIFHYDTVDKICSYMIPHWHENIELLFFTKGEGLITLDTTNVVARAGDIIVVNSNHLHHITAMDDEIGYYCLIIDKEFCQEFDFFTEEHFLQSIISDETAQNIFKEIVHEFDQKEQYYKSAIKSSIVRLLTHLYRTYRSDTAGMELKARSNRTNMVKDTIKFVQLHYKNPISIDEIAKEVG